MNSRLFLASGQLGEGGVALVGQAEGVEERPPVGRLPVERGEEREGLADLDVVGQGALLELDPDPLPELPPLPPRVQPQDGEPAAVGAPQSFETLDGRGLAGAVRADDAEDLVLPDVEADPVHGHQACRRSCGGLPR